jgi:hypothetical protein
MQLEEKFAYTFSNARQAALSPSDDYLGRTVGWLAFKILPSRLKVIDSDDTIHKLRKAERALLKGEFNACVTAL